MQLLNGAFVFARAAFFMIGREEQIAAGTTENIDFQQIKAL